MGGRGAYSSIGIASPGGNAPGGKWSSGLGFQNYDTLRNAIGRKGNPKSMADATLNSNPHFDRSYTFREFNENCQRAVIAYEARRRGYDVTAQPTYNGDNMGAAAYINPKTGVRNSYWMGAFKNAKPEKVGAITPQKTKNNLESKMKSFGNGSRAIMQVQWKNNRGGHVINVEYKNGKTYYNDAQVGKKYNANQLFSAIKTQSTQLTRTDNLKLSDRAKKMITKDKW